MYLSTSKEARPRERSDRGRFLPLGKKPLHTGVRTGGHYLISPSVYVCVTFVLFIDCDSCTRPISTNSVSMEAGKYGLTSGTCFFARCLEVVAVAGLLRLSWCVLGGVDFFVCVCVCVFFCRLFVFFERTRPTASMRPPLASFTSLLVMRQIRGSLATEAVFCL